MEVLRIAHLSLDKSASLECKAKGTLAENDEWLYRKGCVKSPYMEMFWGALC